MKVCRVCEKEYDSRRRKYCSEGCRFESKKQTALAWNKANKEKHADHQRAHREKDPEVFKRKEKVYYNNKTLTNPGYYTNKTAKYDASKSNASPKWLTAEQKQEITSIYVGASKLSKMTGVSHHVDHIMPLQGECVSGLHVPANLQILTETENCSKGNKIENKPILYMLCGQSGVGKTTLLEDFKDTFEVISYDSTSDQELDDILPIDYGKPIILDIGIKISTIIKRYKNHCYIRPIFMIEPLSTVEERIRTRGGNTLNASRRYNRIVSLSNKNAYYVGNTEDVRYFLDELQKTFRN